MAYPMQTGGGAAIVRAEQMSGGICLNAKCPTPLVVRLEVIRCSGRVTLGKEFGLKSTQSFMRTEHRKQTVRLNKMFSSSGGGGAGGGGG